MARLLAILVVILAVLAPRSAEACRCMQPDVTTAFASHPYTFVGRVLDVREGPNWVVHRVRVLRSFGDCLERRIVLVGSPASTAACGVRLGVGETWLVFAHEQVVGGVRRLVTTSCDGSRPARDVLRWERSFLDARSVDCGAGPTCADGSEPVACLVDPCEAATCDERGATCTASYCGGCHAEWTGADGLPTCLPW